MDSDRSAINLAMEGFGVGPEMPLNFGIFGQT
jgi:hypothetical protein